MSDEVFAAALRLLARRDHFAAELAAKLARRGFPGDEVEHAAARGGRRGRLDDHRLAARFVELRRSDRGWGPHRLAAELRRRGLDPDLAAAAVRVADDDGGAALAAALDRLELRRSPGWWRLPAARARMLSSLVNRGFDVDDAVRAVADRAARRRADDDDHLEFAEDDDQPGDPVDFS